MLNDADGTQTPPAYNEKMLAAKAKLLERFKREGELYQPPTLKTTPEQRAARRVPPGQHLTKGFPVLDLGVQPQFNPETWRFKVWGDVEDPIELTWDEWKQLPRVRQTTDFHCVTTWSKLDVQWGGVRFSDLAALVMPTEKAQCVIQHGAEGYTTNAPLEELMDDDVLIADEFVLELNGVNNGWQSIPTERGGPVRMIVPKLYAWKGSKFLIGMRFQQQDEPGFWETRGYHNHADPWRMERYGAERSR
jgi:DMSO/TMAO reductase YedYZ molybdopterin-dependent catalytic subunit